MASAAALRFFRSSRDARMRVQVTVAIDNCQAFSDIAYDICFASRLKRPRVSVSINLAEIYSVCTKWQAPPALTKSLSTLRDSRTAIAAIYDYLTTTVIVMLRYPLRRPWSQNALNVPATCGVAVTTVVLEGRMLVSILNG